VPEFTPTYKTHTNDDKVVFTQPTIATSSGQLTSLRHLSADYGIGKERSATGSEVVDDVVES